MNLFHIVLNITTVVGTSYRWHTYERKIYAQSIVINIFIGNILFCSRGGRI